MPQAMNELKNAQEAKEFKIKTEMEAAQKAADFINGKSVHLYATAGQGGRLFGSVTAKEIAEEIKKQFQVDVETNQNFHGMGKLRRLALMNVISSCIPEFLQRLKRWLARKNNLELEPDGNCCQVFVFRRMIGSKRRNDHGKREGRHGAVYAVWNEFGTAV